MTIWELKDINELKEQWLQPSSQGRISLAV